MTQRLIGEVGSRKRRRFLFVPVLLVALAALFVIAGAQAVHDDGVFQLDRNAYTAADGGVKPAAHDWDQVCPASTPAGIGGCLGNPGTDVSSFTTDPDGATIFTGGGSKDDLDLTQWLFKDGSVPDKDEIQHAMAARYGDLLYFAADREATNGDSQIGFWFFQKQVKLAPGAAGGFVGADGNPVSHTNGDLLILSDFTQGGTAPTVRVFKWHSPGGAINGTLDLIAGSTATPADCLGLPASGKNPAVPPVNNNDPFCAVTNLVNTNSPWAFTPKSGAANVYGPGAFYEGGVDLADPSINLAGECFSSFLTETRSSQSVDATLKDFVLGGFGACTASLKTQTSKTTLQVGDAAPTDTATINVGSAGSTPPAPTGSVSFYLCGPSATAITVCDPTGKTAFSTVNLSTATKVGNDYSVTSSAPTITSAGYYCFAARWPGDTKYTGGPFADDGTNECFQVTPKQPAITTEATAAPSGGAALGTAIDDTAHLTGTSTDPDGSLADGTITFTLYGPNDATCTTAIETSVVTITNGGDGFYKASDGVLSGTLGSLTPKAAGTYRWIAVYSGDSPNTLGVSGACNDANEASLINPKQPAITTEATAAPPGGAPLGTAIDDTAHLTGTALDPDGSKADGTITFTLYGPNDATCATAIATRVVTLTDGGDGFYKASDGTGTGSLTPTTAGTYRWIAVYSGDSPNTLGVSGACNDTGEASLLISLQPTISTAQKFVPNDSATITVAAGGGNLAGSVRFRLYSSADCTTGLLYDSNTDHPNGFPVSGGLSQTVTTDNTTPITTTATTLAWLVEYTNTNPAHKDVTSACNVEHSSLTIVNGP